MSSPSPLASQAGGSQADNLFYLNPHHARPAIPLRSPPSAAVIAAQEQRATGIDNSDVEQKREPGHFTPVKKER